MKMNLMSRGYVILRVFCSKHDEQERKPCRMKRNLYCTENYPLNTEREQTRRERKPATNQEGNLGCLR